MKNINSVSDLPKVNIIKVLKMTGDKKSAVLADGRVVYRQDKLWMGKEYGLVSTSKTSSHFIYHDLDFDQKTGEWPRDARGFPLKKYIGRWTPICTCSSAAGVVGSNVYDKFSSPTTKADSSKAGQMVVCLHLMMFGVHEDGSHD